MRTLLLVAVLLASGCERCGCDSCSKWRAEQLAERQRLVEEHRRKRCNNDMDVMTDVIIPSTY
jgi:hypothetical protein